MPTKLKYTIEALIDDSSVIFDIRLVSVIKNRVSENQYRIIENYSNARSKLLQAEQDFIKLFTSELN